MGVHEPEKFLAGGVESHPDTKSTATIFVTGYKHGYVQKIFDSIAASQKTLPPSKDGSIPVISLPSRKEVPVVRYAAYSGSGTAPVATATNSAAASSALIARRIVGLSTRSEKMPAPEKVVPVSALRSLPDLPPAIATLAGSEQDFRLAAQVAAQSTPKPSQPLRAEASNSTPRPNPSTPKVVSRDNQDLAPAVAVFANAEDDMDSPVTAQQARSPKARDPAFVY